MPLYPSTLSSIVFMHSRADAKIRHPWKKSLLARPKSQILFRIMPRALHRGFLVCLRRRYRLLDFLFVFLADVRAASGNDDVPFFLRLFLGKVCVT
jgi:hypothetical protein